MHSRYNAPIIHEFKGREYEIAKSCAGTFVLLLAAPVMAQRLPAPKIGSIAIYELKEFKNIHGWCILVFWERMPETEYGTFGQGELAYGYAIRLWKSGNKKKAPKIAHRKLYDQHAPADSGWYRVSYANGQTGWNDKLFVVKFCGYDENQEVKLRVRGIGENGKMSKVFTVKLPKFGALGNPKKEGNLLISSKIRIVYGDDLFWW